jgi:hypothetical protein
MDESPKQLISEARPSSPMKPGQDSRIDYVNISEYTGSSSNLGTSIQHLVVDKYLINSIITY